MELSILQLVAVYAIPVILAITLHEAAHAFVASRLGDRTAEAMGRVTINPVKHVDPVGTLLVPGLILLASKAMGGGLLFGWAKPVPVIKERLRNPRFGMMAVAAAGPGTNLLLALIGAAVFGVLLHNLPITGEEAPLWVEGMYYFLLINVFLAFFNLLPIPPFDGSHIVEGLLPPSLAKGYEKLRPFGLLLFIGLIAVTWFAPQLGLIDKLVGPPVDWAMERLYAVARLFGG